MPSYLVLAFVYSTERPRWSPIWWPGPSQYDYHFLYSLLPPLVVLLLLLQSHRYRYARKVQTRYWPPIIASIAPATSQAHVQARICTEPLLSNVRVLFGDATAPIVLILSENPNEEQAISREMVLMRGSTRARQAHHIPSQHQVAALYVFSSSLACLPASWCCCCSLLIMCNVADTISFYVPPLHECACRGVMVWGRRTLQGTRETFEGKAPLLSLHTRTHKHTYTS